MPGVGRMTLATDLCGGYHSVINELHFNLFHYHPASQLLMYPYVPCWAF